MSIDQSKVVAQIQGLSNWTMTEHFGDMDANAIDSKKAEWIGWVEKQPAAFGSWSECACIDEFKRSLRPHYNEFQGMSYDDTDIVNPDDYDFGSYRPYAIVESIGYGSIIRGIAFADNESDALDEVADSGKLDCLIIPNDEIQVDEETGEETDDCGGYISRIGNYGKPIQLDDLHIIAMPRELFSHLASTDESAD